MKRTLEQMYNNYDSHRPLKRHKTTNELYELMVSLERRISNSNIPFSVYCFFKVYNDGFIETQ